MNDASFDVWTRRLIAPLATMFFVVMFLDWHETSVNIGDAVAVQGTASAWHGWGAIAGFAAAGLLLWTVLERFDAEITKRLSDELVTATLAVATLAFTIVEFLVGTASVSVAGAVEVTTTVRWPAYVALAVSAVLAFVALAPLERPEHRHGGRFGLGTR